MSQPTSNLYVGRKCIGASKKPLKIEPGRGEQYMCRVTIITTQQTTSKKHIICKHTIIYFLCKLVMLQQRGHFTTIYVTYDVLHLDSLLTQAKVKISEPEYLVESRGDVS